MLRIARQTRFPFQGLKNLDRSHACALAQSSALRSCSTASRYLITKRQTLNTAVSCARTRRAWKRGPGEMSCQHKTSTESTKRGCRKTWSALNTTCGRVKNLHWTRIQTRNTSQVLIHPIKKTRLRIGTILNNQTPTSTLSKTQKNHDPTSAPFSRSALSSSTSCLDVDIPSFYRSACHVAARGNFNIPHQRLARSVWLIGRT